jgi:putative hemolysin
VAGRLTPALLPMLLLGACTTTPPEEDGTGGGAQLANPSAVFCEDQGGTYSLDEETCALPDGSVVDAWDYYREQASEPE